MDRHPQVGQVLAATMARRLGDLFQKIRTRDAQPPLSQAETFLFRKEVSEVMVSPVLSLPPEAPPPQPLGVRFLFGDARRGDQPVVLLPIQERYLLHHALEATGRLQGLVHASFGDLFF